MIGVLESEVGGNVLLRTLLDAIPVPVFLIGEEVQVVGFNSAAERVLGHSHNHNEAEGEFLNSIRASQRSNVYGQNTGSGSHFVPNLVMAAFSGQNSVRQRAVIRLTTPKGTRDIHIRVTTSLITVDNCRRVLMTIEEAVERVPSKRLVPICAKCKRIRDGQDHWTSLEHYLSDSFGVRLSHGLCPECLNHSLAQVGLELDTE